MIFVLLFTRIFFPRGHFSHKYSQFWRFCACLPVSSTLSTFKIHCIYFIMVGNLIFLLDSVYCCNLSWYCCEKLKIRSALETTEYEVIINDDEMKLNMEIRYSWRRRRNSKIGTYLSWSIPPPPLPSNFCWPPNPHILTY